MMSTSSGDAAVHLRRGRWRDSISPFLLAVALIAAPAAAEQTYQSAQEAYAVGAAFLSQGNFAASLQPFEAALALAPNDDDRGKIYEALLPAYRQLPEPDKFIAASDFVIRHSGPGARRSLMRRSLLSFVFQRGQTDALIQRYEQALQRDDADRAALYVLSGAYAQIKKDPAKAAALTERLVKLEEQAGGPVDVATSAELAAQYVLAGKFSEGAEVFERIAPLDMRLEPWHWKEAAQAWLKAGDRKKALKAARNAERCGPDQRTDLLTYFWHRHLADLFVAIDEPDDAIPHYEAAIEITSIEGYRKECQDLLKSARNKAQ